MVTIFGVFAWYRVMHDIFQLYFYRDLVHDVQQKCRSHDFCQNFIDWPEASFLFVCLLVLGFCFCLFACFIRLKTKCLATWLLSMMA